MQELRSDPEGSRCSSDGQDADSGAARGHHKEPGKRSQPKVQAPIKTRTNQVRCVGAKTNLFSCIFLNKSVNISKGKKIPFFSVIFT